MAKIEPWFVRLTIDGFDKANRLMTEFGFPSRDIFAERVLEVLAKVKNGEPLPDWIDHPRGCHETATGARITRERADEQVAPSSGSNGPARPSLKHVGHIARNIGEGKG